MNPSGPVPAAHEVRIPCGDAWLYGDFMLPENAAGLVLFVHNSGNGRHSASDRLVALQLQQAGLGTLLFDLLTVQEGQSDPHARDHRFDIALLTQRLQDASLWAMAQPSLQALPVGYFSVSNGSAAAVIAAARLGAQIAAVVSRSGRPDLAGPVALATVTAPTLLIAGQAEAALAEFNEQSLTHLVCGKRLAIVEGATPALEDKAALEKVAGLAADWFKTHFSSKFGQEAPL
ncbi:MAG: dienelactone hydrolase [Polaromonas sp.]|nr:dienelactone hydrolase [Polaromonas sp.]